MPGGDPRRADRVAEAIREEVAVFLREGAKDPRLQGLVTVTGVDVTRDLRHAKVFVSVMGSDAEKAATFEGLASVAGHLRSRLGRALRLRAAPDVVFREDDSVARAARIEHLLAQIRTDDTAATDAPAADPADPAGNAADAGDGAPDGDASGDDAPGNGA